MEAEWGGVRGVGGALVDGMGWMMGAWAVWRRDGGEVQVATVDVRSPNGIGESDVGNRTSCAIGNGREQGRGGGRGV